VHVVLSTALHMQGLPAAYLEWFDVDGSLWNFFTC